MTSVEAGATGAGLHRTTHTEKGGPLRALTSHRVLVPAVTIVAGVLIAAGALLPWMRFFAGLQSYSGLQGGNGRLLLGGGVAMALLGLMAARGAPHAVRWAIGLLGFALASLSGWVLVGGLRLVGDLAEQPMLVAELGPGPLVSVVGSLLAVATMLLPAPSRQTETDDIELHAGA